MTGGTHLYGSLRRICVVKQKNGRLRKQSAEGSYAA